MPDVVRGLRPSEVVEDEARAWLGAESDLMRVPVAYPSMLNLTLTAAGALVKLCRRADVLPFAHTLQEIADEWMSAPWDWPSYTPENAGADA